MAQGEGFSTSGVSDANAAARVKGDGDSLYAKSATATYPYTYPAASALTLVSASDTYTTADAWYSLLAPVHMWSLIRSSEGFGSGAYVPDSSCP